LPIWTGIGKGETDLGDHGAVDEATVDADDEAAPGGGMAAGKVEVECRLRRRSRPELR
jgi:hypothetical protein